jgi:hypothetical protein
MSFGKTGAINPSASMSSMTVIKINVMAAGRDFMLVERERTRQRCRGGCVNAEPNEGN